jgi:hypothetical protein
LLLVITMLSLGLISTLLAFLYNTSGSQSGGLFGNSGVRGCGSRFYWQRVHFSIIASTFSCRIIHRFDTIHTFFLVDTARITSVYHSHPLRYCLTGAIILFILDICGDFSELSTLCNLKISECKHWGCSSMVVLRRSQELLGGGLDL